MEQTGGNSQEEGGQGGLELERKKVHPLDINRLIIKLLESENFDKKLHFLALVYPCGFSCRLRRLYLIHNSLHRGTKGKLVSLILV